MADETPIAKPRKTILELLQEPATLSRLRAASTDYLTGDKLLRLAMTAINKNRELAWCSTDSMIAALMACSALGLEPNTPLGHAALIPYRRFIPKIGASVREVQFQIMYKGWVHLAHRNKDLVLMQADGVRERDKFRSYLSSEVESGTFFQFEKCLDDNPGELVNAFCFTRMVVNNHRSDMVTVLPRSEVWKARARSETYRKLSVPTPEGTKDYAKIEARRLKNFPETPWVYFENDMWAKTAIKKHCKQLPIHPDIIAAQIIDDAAEDDALDIEALADPDAVRDIKAGTRDARKPERATPALTGPSDDDEDEIDEEEAAPRGNQVQVKTLEPEPEAEAEEEKPKPRKKRSSAKTPPAEEHPVQEEHESAPAPREEPKPAPKLAPPADDDEQEDLWNRR